KARPKSKTQPNDQAQAEPVVQTIPSIDSDCNTLAELLKIWNNPEKISWVLNEEGSCCNGKDIVCDYHLGKKRIVELNLKNSTLSGDITEKITQLKYLTNLSLAENKFTTLPQNLDKLIYLTKFVRQNNITGNIPNNIGNIDGIFHL
ncbi:hypothetical protein PIROE2DRAFT_4914, partial [Piromyces sp. E2]